MYLLYLFAISVWSIAASDVRRYDGYRLLRVNPKSEKQVQTIRQLQEDDIDLDFWSESVEYVDILVSPEKFIGLTRQLMTEKISYKIQNDNIQKDIDDEKQRLMSKRKRKTETPGTHIDYDDYNTYSEIINELDAIVARCPTESGVSCETFVFGQSTQGRQLKGIKIFRTDREQEDIWIDSTIHAREWLATATILKIISHLVDDYSTDSEAQDLVDRYTWHLVPLINPDGYDYTWTSDRLWRKSRNANSGSACIGVDLNRNFDQKWQNAGTSTNPCSDTFGGSGPASEPETKALQDILVSLGSELIISIHLHTYSQFWLIPWGSVLAGGSCEFADDDALMMVVANAAADATQNTHGSTWLRGNWCTILYPASGNAQDYSKASAGVTFTFTPELRGTNFIISPANITPSFQEVWNGVAAAIGAIENVNVAN